MGQHAEKCKWNFSEIFLSDSGQIVGLLQTVDREKKNDKIVEHQNEPTHPGSNV